MGSTVLSLRVDGELLDRLRRRAATRGMSVQDYVVRTLVRDDFDERFQAAVEKTEEFYGARRQERREGEARENGDVVADGTGKPQDASGPGRPRGARETRETTADPADRVGRGGEGIT
ncbi:hypothetical protein PZB75_18790 [Streptomyces sp. AM 4-1-1]|uniref:hypothetical protein n=1 Tax=Streptomyces sp. AM 4-1-1 TaxID=3028710 RepID=UPI0023B93E25|nr:hypothetical protein [Streptomyces sp. AM 4-1-1]WEH37751.1 hypothetical protein PZB75_18790 [Streptomyces sp. AM 4-1-1]